MSIQIEYNYGDVASMCTLTITWVELFEESDTLKAVVGMVKGNF